MSKDYFSNVRSTKNEIVNSNYNYIMLNEAKHSVGTIWSKEKIDVVNGFEAKFNLKNYEFKCHQRVIFYINKL